MSTVNGLLNILAPKEKDVADEKEKRNQEKVIIKRYFPGKVPDYAKGAKEDEEEDDDEDYEDYSNDGENQFTSSLIIEQDAYRRQEEEEEKKREPYQTGIETERQFKKILKARRNYEDDDERYELFEKKKQEIEITGNKEERVKRRVREVVVLEKEETQKKVVDIFVGNDADNVCSVDFFQKGNEKKDKKKEEEEENEEDEENEDEENEDEEEEEEDDDDDSYMDDDEEDEEDDEDENDYTEKGEKKDTKPNFISKGKRETLIKNKKAKEVEEKEIKNRKKEKEKIEEESKEIAIKESLYQDMIEEELKNKKGNVLLSSEEEFEENDEDDDYTNEEIKEKEYKLWKIRELNRLKRDEIDRKKYDILKEKIKKRRKMTDKEIIEDNKNIPNKQKQKKEKMLFLQKYYHKGGFYQDLFEEGKEEIYKRNYNEPVYEDKIDKTKLPKILRLRRGNWGKQGRSKYTHLLDNDTSVKESLWKEGTINSFSKKKKTDILDRPTYRKK